MAAMSYLKLSMVELKLFESLVFMKYDQQLVRK